MNSISISEIKQRLTETGLKATHPRLIIYAELVKDNFHPTPDQLYERIKVDHPGIAKGTVYRVLDRLVDAGLVSQVSSRQGIKRYDANLEGHSHIYCTKTHEIQDYYSEELEKLLRKFFASKNVENFNISEIKLQINGVKIDPEKKVNIK